MAKDKQRQEAVAAEQCQADDERLIAPVMLPDPVDAAIQCIWKNCALRAAPLKAILAMIECEDIAHEARAPPTTTLPHPAAMLSIPPRPMTYVGVDLSTMGGEH